MRKLNQRTHTKTKAAQALVESTQEALNTGLVVATHGRHCVVELDNGSRIICHPRGKKSQSVVGDRVRWQAAADEGTIESVLERRNLFYRRDEVRTKSFAANLDQVLILLAAEPEFSETQLSRALIAAEAEHIKPLVVLNKSDLNSAFPQAWARLAAYRQMGYTVMPLQLKQAHDVNDSLRMLQAEMAGKTTLILGPSGAGKSTLVNALVPNARALTGEISQALNSGKHTTTSTSLYWVGTRPSSLASEGAGTAIIDSPGFQEFGLQHIPQNQLASCMPDLKQYVGSCKFYNCTHLHEPGCGVLTALQKDENVALQPSEVSQRRHRIYAQLFEELGQQRW
ncbi:MAG: putative ribosome biosis GTPase RsgA [Pseudomonadota bacterium]|jgi:ribosome biogenesis GTPase